MSKTVKAAKKTSTLLIFLTCFALILIAKSLSKR